MTDVSGCIGTNDYQINNRATIGGQYLPSGTDIVRDPQLTLWDETPRVNDDVYWNSPSGTV